MRTAGFTVIEVLVAISVASLVTASLTSTMVAAHRQRSILQRSAEAARLAQASLEELAATGRLAPFADDHGLERSGALEPWNNALGLRRAHVRVTSREDPHLAIELATLVRE